MIKNKTKPCAQCGTEFVYKRMSHKYCCSNCCFKAFYHRNNKDQRRYHRERYNSSDYCNKDNEARKAYQKEYYAKNKEARKAYQKEYYQKRYKTDPIFKLKNDIANLIRSTIKRRGFTKNCKTSDILGCDTRYFREFIADKFTEGMTWDNYGEWEFDHRTPISWAETEEEVRELNHYTNFQPKWKKDNREKGNKFAD